MNFGLATPAMISTWYGDIESLLMDKFAQIKLVIFDVDGVFSDGRIYLGNQGEELKAFHTRDGFGVKALLNAGIKVAVITGRRSALVENRMRALGVSDIYQGQEDKLSAYQQLAEKYQLTDQAIACMGDDIPDLAMLQQCAVAVAPHDAHPFVQQHAVYVTSRRGGFGAVRELSDLILLSQGQLQLHGGVSL
ncbi:MULTISPECIES: 3-deoxy-manno-octulosonate-8-phosphatase KdsC [Pseudidiomarina]|uniref:3-deoxy-D-manno-octulosonate 8-phosphate phosphatase KdsC n=2 Tax=Pseudidiomarina TaxID=2800384 RepID=A0A368UZ90_9GAMM|nr:3-deoxy-D-manno-octulosonate 8-phosphate phosphatase (KDO 8-P phosphatase) [Pseudidiomarina maritima]RBP90425.1 3-deoxy-D-manno-octulosonate 8-phosphate phosphatase (KDO 8-P phosphatase) [Pseudidiomarina tainanensis]RCW32101.1 3-deoxy-D-manno-octulosonate 8-phosphate phosphatase (KDO 8-P phosphatase) [Pseudidiomarina tainanensis]